jgi:hypothetical protein
MLPIKVIFHPEENEEDSYFEAENENFKLNSFGKTEEKSISSLKKLIFSHILMDLMNKK